MQKAIGYIRVSTQGQADEGVSLEAQRAKIRAWCELNDAELVAVFEDAGLSGASMKGREGLDAALKAKGPFMLEIDMLSIGTFKTAFAGPPVNKEADAENGAKP